MVMTDFPFFGFLFGSIGRLLWKIHLERKSIGPRNRNAAQGRCSIGPERCVADLKHGISRRQLHQARLPHAQADGAKLAVHVGGSDPVLDQKREEKIAAKIISQFARQRRNHGNRVKSDRLVVGECQLLVSKQACTRPHAKLLRKFCIRSYLDIAQFLDPGCVSGARYFLTDGALGIPGKNPVNLRACLHEYAKAGITSATPNEAELEALHHAAIGRDISELTRCGAATLAEMKLQSLLVTRGRDGMALFEPEDRLTQISVYGSDQAVDVTGAGDTVLAAYTVALACGASPLEAAHIANIAGGLVVMKRGTATVTRDELLTALRQQAGGAAS